MASVAAAPDDPESHAQAGWSLLLLGRADTALSAFTEAIRLDPWGAHHFAHRALAHAARLDRRKAEVDIARARELRPHDAQVVSIHGQVLTILGRTRQARAVHAEALRLEPALGQVHRADARAHLDGGRLDQASAALTRALAANPQDDGSQAQIADLVLSVCRRLMLLGWLGAAAAAWTVLAGASAGGRLGLAVGVVALGGVAVYLPWREAGRGVRSVAVGSVRRDRFLALSVGLAVLPHLVALCLLALPGAGATLAVQLSVVLAVVVNVLHPFLVSRWQSARGE